MRPLWRVVGGSTYRDESHSTVKQTASGSSGFNMGERWFECGPSWSQIFMWGFWLKAYVFVGLGWFYDIEALRDVGTLFGITAVALTVHGVVNRHDVMVRRELKRARERGEDEPGVRLVRKS